MQEGTLARSLLSTAIEEADPDARNEEPGDAVLVVSPQDARSSAAATAS